MYAVVVYDVAVERIDGVRQLLRQYLNWVQNSAFEGDLSEATVEELKVRLRELIHENVDSVLIYTVSDRRWIRRSVLGIEKGGLSELV